MTEAPSPRPDPSASPPHFSPKSLPPRLSLGRRFLIACAAICVSAFVFPRWIAGCSAGAWFDGDASVQAPFARHVAAQILEQKALHFYTTGDSRFDGQSAIAIYQMALLGMGQTILSHPEMKDDLLPAMEAAADKLVDPKTLTYATKAYGQHACAAPFRRGHAYAGYINMGLGVLRLVHPQTRHAALHDRLTANLREQLFASKTGLIETYPAESWPPDVAVVAGSIGLHAAATGLDIRADADAWAERFEKCALHAPSGYLYQQLQTGSCTPVDAPRGSGTAIGSYAIGFLHEGLSRKLAAALAAQGQITLLGFGGLREYAEGFGGKGDTNAGPILFGASVGATGFGLGAARMNRDRALFVGLYRSTHLAGLPLSKGDEGRFGAGGILGDALLLAMLTARRP